MISQTALLKEIEAIKTKLFDIELSIIESEIPTKEDVKAVKEALAEYKSGKSIPFSN